ncbi:hypothetical protein AVEN_109432-1 [Araneus ventricosus]|uniref:PiggyBac transposable element-derived protein domain-containing protein n=1 Tax=Araneus ventricosus TaxID=182803 RepID=A0A4Y2NMT6_ARAVE|nr:hypothetical protein AVEN_109432-1 [Araneus ventricosus]
MPRKRYLALEEAIQRLFEDDTDDNEQSDIDIVVVPPETAESSDEGNDNILNHDNDDLPCDTAGETEVHSKKFESSESSCNREKKLKKSKTEYFKWIKKEPLNMPQPKNEEKDRIEIFKNKIKDKT